MNKYITSIITIVALTFPALGLIQGKKVETQKGVFKGEQQGVILHAELLSGTASKEQLKKDLVSRGLQPVQLTIDNQTSKELSIGMKSISLPQASAGIAA